MTTMTAPDPRTLAEGRTDDALPLYVAGRWEAAAGAATHESYEPATGLEVMQHYTQTKSVWVDLQEDPADWFGDA